MKKNRLTMGLVASAFIAGCGGMSDQELAKSLEGFNQYCMTNNDAEMIKIQALDADPDAYMEAYSKLTMYGLKGEVSEHVIPLESYEKLDETNQDGLWCQLPSDGDGFVLPDLSHLGFAVSLRTESDAITLFPDGMSVRSLTLTGGSLESLDTLSGVTIEADTVDTFSQAHFTLYDGSEDLHLPDEWSLDISGDRPFTVRLEVQIAGYGGLKDVDEAHIVFGESVYSKNMELMPADSAFCESYGSGTQAFLDKGQVEKGLEAGPEDWEKLPAKTVCNV